jgi:hypothetical protein
MEEEKEAKKKGRLTKKQAQQLLIFPTVTGPREFTREGVLNAVTRLIATNNLVSLICGQILQTTHDAPVATRAG